MVAARGRSSGHVHQPVPMTRDEAMQIAATEYERFVALLRALADADWDTRIDDCPAWNVRELTAHVIANAEAIANPIENVRQLRAAKARAKTEGEAFIDALGEVGVAPRRGLSPAELTDRLERAGAKSVKARRRMPKPLRALKLTIPPPIDGRVTVAYMMDTIYTRDVWMHRVDLCRATGTEIELTPDHDGVLVADVVAEWARRHGTPCSLTLDGPAGGTFELNGGDDSGGANTYRLGAVEFCRTVSGRARGRGLLTTDVPF